MAWGTCGFCLNRRSHARRRRRSVHLQLRQHVRVYGYGLAYTLCTVDKKPRTACQHLIYDNNCPTRVTVRLTFADVTINWVGHAFQTFHAFRTCHTVWPLQAIVYSFCQNSCGTAFASWGIIDVLIIYASLIVWVLHQVIKCWLLKL